MDNIRTRTGSSPIPKLPLTWEAQEDAQEQQDTEASSGKAVQELNDSMYPEQDNAEMETSTDTRLDISDTGNEQENETVSTEETQEDDEEQDDMLEESSVSDVEVDVIPDDNLNKTSNVATPAESVLAENQDTSSAQEKEPQILTLSAPVESSAQILKRARAEKGVSISDVCRKTFITQTLVVDLENGNFARLPDLSQCLVKLESLCKEYEIDPQALLENFTKEYETYRAEDEGSDSRETSSRRPGYSYRNSSGGRSPVYSIPSIAIVCFVFLLVAFLCYAFYAYNLKRLPERLNVNLTDHVPVHHPKIIYADELRTRR